jgi:hypothetical protein
VADRNHQLEAAITRTGHTRSGLAEAVGRDAKTIERWITRGITPQPEARRAVAEALGTPEGLLWPDAGTAVGQGSTELASIYVTRRELPAGTIETHARTATRNISVLAYAASWLWDGVPNFVGRLILAAQGGVMVRVCLGDPTGSAVSARGREEGIGDELMRARSALALQYVSRLTEEFPECVRTHDTPLYASILQFDDNVYVNWHLYGIGAPDAPVFHFRHQSPSGVAGKVLDSFESVWAQAQVTG